MQQKAVIFIGVQGAGKGTQYKLLRQYLEEHDPQNIVFTFDTGQALREIYNRDGYAYQKMKHIMNDGKFLADWIPSWLFSDTIINSYQFGNHIMIDGFPRSVNQARTLNEVLTFYDIEHVDVINMSVSEEISIERALARGREDDTVEAVKQRLSETHRVMQPIMDYLENETDFHIHTINGAQHIEKVTQDIFHAIGIK